MSVWDIFTIVTSVAGLYFFAAGSLGLLRFPDVFSRLNALTKVDNLGLGLIAVGLVPQVTSGFDAIQLVVIWILVMISSAVTSFLIADYGFKWLARDATVNSGANRGEPKLGEPKPGEQK